MIYLSVKRSRNSSCLIERENGRGSVGFEYSSIYNRVNILSWGRILTTEKGEEDVGTEAM